MNNQSKALWLRLIAPGETSSLSRYILAATLARISTGAAAVSIILLARTYGAEGKMAGTLAACLTAPHVFGPIYGRWLDETQDPRWILAATSLLFTVFFQLGILGFEWNLIWLTVASFLICGVCSSFMMGGLSTQLIHLVDDDMANRRRAQSWDTITYGFGLTVGPLLIATLVMHLSIESSAALVMGLPVLAGLIILYLPKPPEHEIHEEASKPGFREVISIMWRSAPLMKTLMMTSGASFGLAVLPVLAIYLSEAWQQSKEQGAYLVTFYGVGCLCGALFLMLKPMKAEALLLLRNVGAVLVLTLILLLVSQSFNMGLVAYWLCGVVNSIFFAVTLAARTDYAPKQGSAQIYMWVAAAKISAASLGALFAGFLVDQAIKLPIMVSTGVLITTLLICFGSSKALRTD